MACALPLLLLPWLLQNNGPLPQSSTLSLSEFQGVRYAVPAGWSEKRQETMSIVFVPNAKPGETLAVVVFPASNDTGTDRQAILSTLIQSIEKGHKVIQPAEFTKKTRGDLTIYLATSQVEDETGKGDRLYELISDGKKLAFVVASVNGDQFVKDHRAELVSLLESVRPSKAESPTGPQRIRIGATPGQYPGSPGWLPSGKGVPFPAPSVVDGHPVGMWWTQSLDLKNRTVAYATIFFPDGTLARFYRPGGPQTADLDGQRAEPGENNVGSWHVSDGQITLNVSGRSETKKLTFKDGPDGTTMSIGGAAYHKALPLTQKLLIGTWQVPGSSEYTFKADGTYQFANSIGDGVSYAAGSTSTGKWTLDGYLLALEPNNGPYMVHKVFRFADNCIVFENTLHFRK